MGETIYFKLPSCSCPFTVSHTVLPAASFNSLLGLWLKMSGGSYIPADSVATLSPRETGGWEGLEYPKQLKKPPIFSLKKEKIKLKSQGC